MPDLPIITSIYFDPTTDFGFKKLFGEEANKDLLMDFLNSLLPSHHQIASLTFQKTEQLPDHSEERKSIYDIYCEDINGEKFIVEMQKSKMTYMVDRTVYYCTFPIQRQAKKGKWNFKLNRVYAIGILDFEYDIQLEHWKERQLLRPFNLRDNNGILMTDNLHFLFLQLPYFSKTENELVTQFDKWCYFLKNLENFDSIPNILKEPIFMKAFDVAEISNMDDGDYILYQISKSKKYDMELLEDEAEQRGVEKGIGIGMDKDRINVVLTAYSQGHSPNLISQFTGIPLDSVLKIIQNYNNNKG